MKPTPEQKIIIDKVLEMIWSLKNRPDNSEMSKEREAQNHILNQLFAMVKGEWDTGK